MKNPKTRKVNQFKNASDPFGASTPTATESCCECCQFLRSWLTRRKHRSEDDVAAALLIHLLWTTKNCAPNEGLCGVSFHPGDLDFLGIAIPGEALAGLQVLAKAGLVAPYFARTTPINGERACNSGAAPILAVDLLWLEEDHD